MLTDVPTSVLQGVSSLLNISGSDIKDFISTGGGCINHGGKLTTSTRPFFLKWNDAARFPGMFNAEASGLNALRKTDSIHIPDIIGFGERDRFQFLLLEFVHQTPRNRRYWKTFAEQLVNLHQHTAEQCGLDHDNYIGSLPQHNHRHESWCQFFEHQRLRVQVDLARRAQLLSESDVKKFEILYTKLPYLLPEDNRSLVHGDLWSGNVIVNEEGDPCLIDPAVYYGNREMDLAMTRLFGGFDEEFYQVYNDLFPLQSGHEDRNELYSLYPLLVHLNLFGPSYHHPVMTIVNRFA